MADGASFTGRAFGRYHLQELVAVSGMGVVYRAWDPRLECTVAIKLISEDTIADTSAAREQLLAEARIASSLNHPNICIIKDVEEASGQTGIVMEFVEGQVLTKLISSHGRLPFEDIVDYGVKIAAAVSHAHERDVIHRDLKSANVMVTPEGRIKLLDFGLSKIKRSTEVPSSFVTPGLNSSSRSIVGTPHYWPPEVINLGPSDARNDIWSMGVLLYEMTSGSMPFEGQSLKELVEAILHGAPAPLSDQVPGQLAKIIHHCLHKQIGQRYQRASEIRAALEAIQPIGEYRQPTKIVSEPLPIRSVAVLPLEDFSGAPGQEYFADGLTESLITALTKISGLHVISRASIMQYKGVRKTVPAIARELGVDAIVEGSVLRVGNRVRISAELIQASTDQNLWAESYERDLSDILSLQSQVALAIARNIKEKVSQARPQPLRGADLPPTKSTVSASLLETWNLSVETPTLEASVNPEAYDLYLRGRYFWNRQNTDENFRKAADYYQRAIEVDPESAVTYAGLAHCLILMGAGEYGLRAPVDIMPKARLAATKALGIEESLAEAHVSLAMVKFRYEHDWPGAETEFVRAIDLNRGYAVAHYWYAVYLMGLSRFDEALREVKIAQQLDPFSPTFHHSLGLLFYSSGQFDEAIEHLRGTIAMDPNFPLAHLTQGLAMLPKARFDEAIEAIQRSLQIAGEIPLWRGFLGQAYGLAGRRNEAQQILNDLLNIRKERYVPAVAIALVYCGLGQEDDAFEWLDKSLEDRDGLLIYLRIGAVFDGVRADKRFLDLLSRVGLQELAPVQPVSKKRFKTPKPIPGPRPNKRIAYGVVLAIVLVAIGIAAWKHWVPPPVTPSRLAILPFQNLSGDPEAQRISEGLTEEMTSSLELLHPHLLTVVQLPPNAASFTPAQIADKYNSGYLLHGTVLLVNHKVAVTVQLILTADQTGIWGDSYERDIDKPEDIIPIMVEIATTIRSAVLEQLPKDLHPVHQVNQQAYESYLTGRFFWNKRTTEDLKKAVTYFDASITQDPGYAPAYAGLADSYSLLGSAPYSFLTPKEAFPKAEAAAYKALTLDPYLAEAHVSLGYAQLSYERDYPKADQEFLEAIRLQPAYATAHQYYGYYLTAMGDLKEAIQERQQARDLDPLSPLLNSAVGEAYYQDRQYDLTIAANQKALQLDPSFAIALVNLARAYEQKKMYVQANQVFERMLAGAPNDPAILALVAHDYAMSGHRAQAVQLLSRLQADATKQYVPALYFAIIYIGLDDKNESFNWLNKAYEERCDYLVNLPSEPFADPLRSDPRFSELLRQLGLKPLANASPLQ